MVTRSKARISKHRVLIAENSESLPATVLQALQVPHWKATMKEEMDALHRTST